MLTGWKARDSEVMEAGRRGTAIAEKPGRSCCRSVACIDDDDDDDPYEVHCKRRAGYLHSPHQSSKRTHKTRETAAVSPRGTGRRPAFTWFHHSNHIIIYKSTTTVKIKVICYVQSSKCIFGTGSANVQVLRSHMYTRGWRTSNGCLNRSLPTDGNLFGKQTLCSCSSNTVQWVLLFGSRTRAHRHSFRARIRYSNIYKVQSNSHARRKNLRYYNILRLCLRFTRFERPTHTTQR